MSGRLGSFPLPFSGILTDKSKGDARFGGVECRDGRMPRVQAEGSDVPGDLDPINVSGFSATARPLGT